METIYVSHDSTSFSLCRWLLLKKKIKQSQMQEYMAKTPEELIKIMNDFDFKVKIRGHKEIKFEPTGSDLWD